MATLNPNVTVAVDDTLTGTTTGLANINLLQPTSFKLVVERKNFINLEFFCQSVAHPNIDVPAAVVPYSRIGSVSMASLLILNSNNNTSRKIRYIDCVPTGLGNMVMEATTGDTTQITFPVTFRFSYFELD